MDESVMQAIGAGDTSALPLSRLALGGGPAPRGRRWDWRGKLFLLPGLAGALAVGVLLGLVALSGPAYQRLLPYPQGANLPAALEISPEEGAAPLPPPARKLALKAEPPPLFERQRRVWPLVRRLARQQGLEPALVMAVIQVESRFLADAVSPRGAAGLMQITPATAQELGLRNPTDPEANLQAGIRYLAQLKKAFEDDLALTLAAYNAGPSKVQTAGSVPDHPETMAYVQNVLNCLDEFRQRFQGLARN